MSEEEDGECSMMRELKGFGDGAEEGELGATVKVKWLETGAVQGNLT